MTVHSLVLFENGSYTELSKAIDLSVHNTITSPETHHLVEDNYITFFYPEHLDKNVVYDYTQFHGFHLIESWELSAAERQRAMNPAHNAISFEEWVKPEALKGYKMFRIHYYTDEPVYWEINPETDLFVFNKETIQSLMLCN